jgi:hypothetical protein
MGVRESRTFEVNRVEEERALKYWLVEAKDRHGAVWGFLIHAREISATQAADRIRALGRAVELSGQLVDARTLDLTSLRVRFDATDLHKDAGSRYTIEGDPID